MTDAASGRLRVHALDRHVLDGVVVDPEAPGDRKRLDVGVLPYFEDERPLQGLAGFVDWRTDGRLSALMRTGFCTGRSGEAVLLPGRRTLPAQRWVLVGLGRSTGFHDERARQTATWIVDTVERLGARDVLMALPGRVPERAAVEEMFAGMVVELRRAPAARLAEEGPLPCWWVIAEGRHVARLRRLLEGPPRAARE